MFAYTKSETSVMNTINQHCHTMLGEQFSIQSLASLNHFRKSHRHPPYFCSVLRRDAIVLFIFLLAMKYWIIAYRKQLISSSEEDRNTRSKPLSQRLWRKCGTWLRPFLLVNAWHFDNQYVIKSHHISYPVKKFKVEFFLEYCFVEWFAIEELVVMGNFDILLIGRGCFVAMIVAPSV